MGKVIVQAGCRVELSRQELLRASAIVEEPHDILYLTVVGEGLALDQVDHKRLDRNVALERVEVGQCLILVRVTLVRP